MDEGAGPEEAAEKVKQKFLGEICAPEKETYFYVGTAQVSIETGQLHSFRPIHRLSREPGSEPADASS